MLSDCLIDEPYLLNGESRGSLELLERLEELRNEGRLLTAGPTPAIDSEDPGTAGFSGSVIIAEFESLEAAQAWADADPYVAAGVYSGVTVKPYKRVY